MAKPSASTLDSRFFLQLCLGIFFLVLGIMGLGDYNSKLGEIARFFGRDDSLRIVAAVVELVMGAFLVLGLFMGISSGLGRIVSIVLFVLWALFILYYFVFNNFLKPDFIPWLYEISWRSVVLAALWSVGKKYG